MSDETGSASTGSSSEDAGHPLDAYVVGHSARPDDPRGSSGARDRAREGAGVEPSGGAAANASTGLSIPPPLQSLDETGSSVPTGIILVSDEGDMGNKESLEYRKMSRQTRYFDEEEFDEPGSNAILCFKCGLVGHMAKDCKNPPKLRPCYLCAAYGHSSMKCPQAACYRCGEVGHQARDCNGGRLEAWEEAFKSNCRLCGTSHCRASGGADLLRAEGKCNQPYDQNDLAGTTCLSCGRLGHASCADLATTRALKSCYNCGESGHIGHECRALPTSAVAAERRRLYSRVSVQHGGRGRRGAQGGGRGRGRNHGQYGSMGDAPIEECREVGRRSYSEPTQRAQPRPMKKAVGVSRSSKPIDKQRPMRKWRR
jgi:cellular nucleic acid-binding protein